MCYLQNPVIYFLENCSNIDNYYINILKMLISRRLKKHSVYRNRKSGF